MPTFDSQSIIEDLIARADSKIRARFGQIVEQLKFENNLEELAKLLAAGDVDAALVALDAAANRLATTINGIFLGAGDAIMNELADKLGVITSFDHTNSRAVALMQANKLELVREFTDEQRAATQEALAIGIRDGLNPIDMARAFRDSIGLTQYQVQAVDNYSSMLENLDLGALARSLRDARFDPTVRRAIENGDALSTAEIDRMTDRYRERFLKYRSEVIARTEALPAVHQASEEVTEQVVENGIATADDIQRTWKSAKDNRVRDFSTGAKTSHRTMHNQVRGYREAFESGAGNLLLYPGDPNAPAEDRIQCRCVVATRISL